MTTHTFLSYAHEDAETADAIKRGLEKNGLIPFKDTGIETGDDWVARIRRNLEHSPSVVVLWSSASVASLWVRTEASEAAHRGILIPVRIESVRVPPLFERFQTLDLIGWSRRPSARAFQRLCGDVKSFVDGRRGSIPNPEWFVELSARQRVTGLDLALEHSTWRDPSKDRDGREMYQCRTILVGHPATLARVRQVTYFLSGWLDGEEKVVSNRGRSFELRQLAFGDFVVQATVEFTTRQKDLELFRFVRLTPSGPYLGRYMLNPSE